MSRSVDRSVEFDLSDMVEVSPTPNLNLPDITATKCICPSDGSPYMVFVCSPSGKYAHGCKNCGSVDYVYNGYADSPRVIHDINIGLARVDLIVYVPKYRCKDCGAIFRHEFDSVPERMQCTSRLLEQIQRECFVRPFSDVAAEFGYTEATIRNFFDDAAQILEENRPPIVAPPVLGIDEKHIVNEKRGVYVDITTGRLLEMTEDNKGETVQAVIESMIDYDKNIRVVTTDMAGDYRPVIRLCLPYAKHIVDKYHVIQLLYTRVQKAKTGLLEYVKEQIAAETDAEKAAHMKDVYGLLARNPYLFKFGKQKLAESRSRLAKMADICATFPVFNHLRLLKEGFERIYEESPDRATAEALYAEWSELVPPKKGTKMISNWESRYGVPASLYKELVTFYTTTQNWYKEIFNYFDPGCQFTNAASEGVNSMIQRINAQGDGYGFKRLRAKALYSSNMGGRISYSINREQVPIYGKTSGENPPGTIGFVMIYPSKPQIIGYRDVAEVVMVQGDGVDPLNVYEYVASDAEYYDFDEEFYDTDEV